ncbi:MAG: bifunctional hydroxymethylpyrimidine kinase/phosphomethylpyrimidine kinase [Clostridia bacterium]|nr:bifunctional hydroxymethylpyrimidine kinase/phosphomethylpyrimidine kinase [Clostridia bacterium]MDE7329163.1 bifunctional hydroxymethylpyrimidine kinase/phosphomethylpyrimidine kinase [Clostridia bacterium]
MKENRVLTIQDFSSVGQCSSVAAVAIISAMGIETIALPIALLSAQTSSFSNYTYVDLSDNLLPSEKRIKNSGLTFDFIYTGYLGKSKIIGDVLKIQKDYPDAFFVVDPAMAEHGKLYDGITDDFVSEITKLCILSDFALPNVSEACMITGVEYKSVLSQKDITDIANKLYRLGVKNFAITGIKTESGMRLALCENGEINYFKINEISGQFFGSGDVFSSAFVGGLARGLNNEAAIKLAMEFTQKAIEITALDKEHYYGLKFEKALPYLVEKINGLC